MRKFQLLLIGLLLSAVLNFQSIDAFSQDKIKWYTIEEVQKLNEQNPKKIYIDVYTDWCGWCKKMDATTFQDPRIIKELNNNFYAVKLNAESEKNITFKNKVYKYVSQGARGYHELAAVLLNGKLSYPTSVYLDENLNMIQPVPGYMTVKNLEPILIFLGEDYYKKLSWKDFLAKNYSPN